MASTSAYATAALASPTGVRLPASPSSIVDVGSPIPEDEEHRRARSPGGRRASAERSRSSSRERSPHRSGGSTPSTPHALTASLSGPSAAFASAAIPNVTRWPTGVPPPPGGDAFVLLCEEILARPRSPWTVAWTSFREQAVEYLRWVLTHWEHLAPPAENAPDKDGWEIGLLDEAIAEMTALFAGCDDYPFTITRLAELLASPRGEYSMRPKYLRALAKMLHVTTPAR